MSMQLPPISVDPLADALQVLRPQGAIYTRSHLTAPWGMEVPAIARTLMFHVVISGQCFFELDGEQPVRLRRGDLVLATRGERQSLRADPGDELTSLFNMPVERVSERYETIRFGGPGAATVLMCGTLQFEDPAARQLIALLPRAIFIDSLSPLCTEWLQASLTLLSAEASTLRIGSEAVVTRLADVVVIQTIRSWIDKDPAAQTGWLKALRDKQVGRAISLIHRMPAHDWTIAALAEAVAMSRSAFAARFTTLVGMTVMQYVTHWRMQLAQSQLQQPNARVSEVATQLGYNSEAAFSRAFKRLVGVPPNEAKRLSPRIPSNARAGQGR